MLVGFTNARRCTAYAQNLETQMKSKVSDPRSLYENNS